MPLKPKQESGPKILIPRETVEYPELDRLQLVKQELQKILISRKTREDVSKILDDENLREDFQKFLAGQISPEFRNELQQIAANVTKHRNNNTDAIKSGITTVMGLITFLLARQIDNPDNRDFVSLIAMCLVLVSGVFTMHSLHKKNNFSENDLKRIKETTAPMKERELMEQLYDYLFCVYQVKHIGAKYSFGKNKKMKELGIEMEAAADEHKVKIGELMAIMEDDLKKPRKSRDEDAEMNRKLQTYLSTIGLLAHLHRAREFKDVSFLSEEDSKILN
jgi:hypothetical protein